MSYARIVLPHSTHFITRRTVLRTHLFAPDDPRIAQLFLYALAVAADRFDVLIHLVILLSNHEHLLATDRRGQLPRFLAFFHRIVALGTKVLRKWDGPVWDHGKTSVVDLPTAQAVIEKMGYGIANPVAAGLVANATDWPGVTTRVDELGTKVWRIERPDFFFDPENDEWPAVAELRLTLPPVAAEIGTPDEFRALVRADVERRERAAHVEMRAAGRKFLGPERCAKQSPYERASSPEPVRDLSPTFAVGAGRHEERRDAIRRVREFRAKYREALAAWRAGARDVPFPPGTWMMVVVHGARVEALERAA